MSPSSFAPDIANNTMVHSEQQSCGCLSHRAFQRITLARRGLIQLCQRVFTPPSPSMPRDMVTFRIRMSPFCDHILHVIEACALRQMVRVAAGRIITAMQHQLIGSQWSVDQDKRHPVSTVDFLTEKESAISSTAFSNTAYPRPAAIRTTGLIYRIPEVGQLLLGCIVFLARSRATIYLALTRITWRHGKVFLAPRTNKHDLLALTIPPTWSRAESIPTFGSSSNVGRE